MSKTLRTKWCKPQILALIAGYEKFRFFENHPVKKQLFWPKIQEYIEEKTEVSINIPKIQAKWRKLKLSYHNASLRNSASEETFSTFQYYEKLYKVFEFSPVCSNSDSSCVINDEKSDQENITPRNSLVSQLKVEIFRPSSNQSSLETIHNSSVEPLENDQHLQSAISNRQRKRRHQQFQNMFDKLLIFKRKELEFKKKKMEYIKEFEKKRAENQQRRRQERNYWRQLITMKYRSVNSAEDNQSSSTII